MSYEIKAEKLETLNSFWQDKTNNLAWPVPFILPPWLTAWWQVFGANQELYIRAIRQDGKLIGIAPLRKKDDALLFIGEIDVCDYLDFIIVPGREEDFFNAFLDDCLKNNTLQLELKHIRPDSITMQKLAPLALARKYAVATAPEDVNVEMPLPADFDAYLESLDTKQRHEVRRKLRRLGESGTFEFHCVCDAVDVPPALANFLHMFVESRQDKAEFLTEQRETFFKVVCDNLAAAGLLRLGILELDKKPVAQIICFDYNNCIYLYNSGYNPEYVSLSAGLLSKVMAIKDSIERGRNKFDFLKGSETYKYHLGGREVPLSRCQITLKR
jgi:CelD/BcsL family acetyltransferase involved in cellulose biosynthesis